MKTFEAMKKLFSLFLLFPFLLPIACARAPQTPTEIPPTPTAIVYPATWTPELTPLPPTATPRPPTRTPDPATREVYKAFERTEGLTVYHAIMDVRVTDPTDSLSKTIPGAKAGEPLLVLSMEGRQNQTDSQWQLKGVVMLFLTGNLNDTLEFRTLGDKHYLNGPLPLFGATQDRWYIATKNAQNDLTTNSPQGLLGEMSNTGTALPTMRAASAEKMDGKACTIYRGDEREAAQFFLAMGERGSIKRNLGNLRGDAERGIFNVWVCEDGYVHKLEMGIQLRAPANAAQLTAVEMTIRLNDMNIIVPIQEPQDAIPLPNPFVIPGYGDTAPFDPPTPTPQTS